MYEINLKKNHLKGLDIFFDIGVNSLVLLLNKSIPKGYRARGILPSFRTSLSATEKSSIKTKMENGEDFGIGYNYRDANLASESWYVIPESNINTTNDLCITMFNL